MVYWEQDKSIILSCCVSNCRIKNRLHTVSDILKQPQWYALFVDVVVYG